MVFTLVPEKLVGDLKREEERAPLANATWYTARIEGDGLAYSFPAGALAGMNYLTADFLIDGNYLVVFRLELQEGEHGPVFGMLYSALNQCSARIRFATEAVRQNRWRYEREGAWLKPMCWGDIVDLSKVDRMRITVLRKSEHPARWCQTAFTATEDEPPLLTEPLLPRGPLIDELGQSTIHDWPARSHSTEEVTERLHTQLEVAPSQHWPKNFSRWGGWLNKRVEKTGFFRTHHDGQRWWLVDPEGYLFWSAGMDCVSPNIETSFAGIEKALTWLPDRDGPYAAAYSRPEYDGERLTINYLIANFIRAFGPDVWHERWAKIALAELRRLGFNTVANWSDWRAAQNAGFPYVRPLHPTFPQTPLVYRDFPDVFHPAFIKDAADFAEQLRPTADDPALIGYFLMNEPTWGFAQETPAAGMLFNTSAGPARMALSDFLRKRYPDDEALSIAWECRTTFATVTKELWHTPLNERAKADLAAFSSIMVERLFKGLSDACHQVDPHHLNLGARYYTVPPEWTLEGMRSFDVFSMNGYSERVPSARLAPLADRLNLPVMIGEWHFGALDVGLPGSGIGHVRDQTARGQAFRVYEEDAASLPWCVGVHYFTLYDESVGGRFDGENWNIGFVDVCNRSYEPLVEAARATHERLYEVVQGHAEPYNDVPEYLPKLFL